MATLKGFCVLAAHEMARPVGTTKRKKSEVIAALRKANGAVYIAARRLGISADTVFRYIKRWRDVAAVLSESRGRVLDFAENRLFSAIKRREAWAIAFALKTIGKDRGYFEKIDAAHWDEEARKLVAILAAAGKADPGETSTGGGTVPTDDAPGGVDGSDGAG